MKSKLSPNVTGTEKNMRADLTHIKKLINNLESNTDGRLLLASYSEDREEIYRELLTSWQSITAMDYQTDARLHLNMLTKRVLNG